MERKLLFLMIFSLFLLDSCINDEMFDDNPIVKTDSIFVMNVKEPSGLAFSLSKDALYTVSDNTGKIYKISFTGDILDELPFVGNDLEGIDVDKTNGDIWVVEEGIQRVDHLNSAGTLINSITSIHVNTISSSGFEGIAKHGDYLYIVVEKEPGVLIKYNLTSNTWVQYNLSFAIDYSGVDYDETDDTLWIVSHESKTLNHCTLDGTLIKSQSIDVVQAEGVVVDRVNRKVWVVSDSGNKLQRITLKI